MVESGFFAEDKEGGRFLVFGPRLSLVFSMKAPS